MQQTPREDWILETGRPRKNSSKLAIYHVKLREIYVHKTRGFQGGGLKENTDNTRLHPRGKGGPQVILCGRRLTNLTQPNLT